MGEHKLQRPCVCGHSQESHHEDTEEGPGPCAQCGCKAFSERVHKPRTPEEFKIELDKVIATAEGEEFACVFTAVALVYGGVLAALATDEQRAAMAAIAQQSFAACHAQDHRLIVPN